VFSKKDFQDWGAERVVLFAAVTTHIQGRKNDDLLGEYGFSGFPSFAILDAAGKTITKKISRDLASIQTAVDAATKYVELEARDAAGKKVDRSALILARLGLDRINVREARQKLAELKLNAKRAREVEALLFDAELQSLVSLSNRNADRAGDVAYGLYKAGKKPATGSKHTSLFHAMLLRGAENTGDGEAFLYAYPHVRADVTKQMQSLAKSEKTAKSSRSRRSYENRLARLKKEIGYMDESAKEFRVAAEAAKKGKK
jgi:hypothetical protein